MAEVRGPLVGHNDLPSFDRAMRAAGGPSAPQLNSSARHGIRQRKSPRFTQGGFDLKWFLQTKSGRQARGMLMEVPAAAEVAAAEATHVAAAKAAHVPAAKAAHVAEVSAGEMAATELAAAEAAHVAEVSAVEMSPVAVESEATVETVVKAVVKAVMEAAASEEDRTTKPVAIVVIRIGVAVTIVVAGAIIRPIVVVAVRIAGGDAADHSGRAGIVAIAVNVAVSVSPNVVVMADVVTRDIPIACVATRNIPVQAV
jgi:hypothetical protein